MLAEMMEWGSPAPFIAFVLATGGGALLAVSHYAVGALLVFFAFIVFGAWRYAQGRGDDDRHTIW